MEKVSLKFFAAMTCASLIGLPALHAKIEQKSAKALKHKFQPPTFSAELLSGFHFNEKAPNKVVIDGKSFLPSTLRAREILFKDLPAAKNSAQASLFVCDDELTTCDMHQIALSKAAAAKNTKISRGKKVGHLNAYGFIVDDFKKALNQAERENKLVLVQFSARWCPSCLRLEKEIFPRADFKALTKDLVKVKLDTDRFANIVVSEKFKVKGVPTLLVVNTKQQEVDRMVDYQSLDRLKAFFEEIRKTPLAMDELRAQAAKDPAMARLLGRRLLAAGRPTEALNVLSSLKPEPRELAEARVEAAAERFNKDPSKRSDYLSALRKAIAAEPQSGRSLYWRISWLETHGDGKSSEKGKLFNEGLQTADAFLADEKKLKAAFTPEEIGEFTGYEPMLAGILRAALVEAAGENKEAVTAAWKLAAATAEKAGVTAKTPGLALRYLIVLSRTGEWEKADQVAQALLRADPSQVDVRRRRLKILFELKKYKEAVALGEKCLKEAYGRNEFWVAELLAKVYIAAEKKKEARALLDRYLARGEADWNHLKSSRESMEKLLHEI